MFNYGFLNCESIESYAITLTCLFQIWCDFQWFYPLWNKKAMGNSTSMCSDRGRCPRLGLHRNLLRCLNFLVFSFVRFLEDYRVLYRHFPHLFDQRAICCSAHITGRQDLLHEKVNRVDKVKCTWAETFQKCCQSLSQIEA